MHALKNENPYYRAWISGISEKVHWPRIHQDYARRNAWIMCNIVFEHPRVLFGTILTITVRSIHRYLGHGWRSLWVWWAISTLSAWTGKDEKYHYHCRSYLTILNAQITRYGNIEPHSIDFWINAEGDSCKMILQDVMQVHYTTSFGAFIRSRSISMAPTAIARLTTSPDQWNIH